MTNFIRFGSINAVFWGEKVQELISKLILITYHLIEKYTVFEMGEDTH